MLPKKKWYTKPIIKVIKAAIKWVECKLINPAYFLLFGEARDCSEEEEEDETDYKTESYDFDPSTLDGTGLDCIEASSTVMLWMMNNITAGGLSESDDLKNLMHIKEQRSNHEANKYGTINNSIKNKDKFSDRIESLNEPTNTIPRYKKRYFNNQ